MSSINWQNLRPWNGSQHSAFEELCCQLAACEKIPGSSVFIRKGTPDGGVECFWRLQNLDEIAWQAKFFSSVDNSQWQQLDESVETALNKHPHLTSYTVCLPIDRPDPRIEGKKSLMDRWNERVEKWQKLSQSKGMTVSFHYWGEHEIFQKLTREDHRGRFLFWFKAELFSDHWFQARLDETVANAGVRYSPGLNVELPIARLFDGLGKTAEFFNRLITLRGKIKKESSRAIYIEKSSPAKAISESLQQEVDQLLAILYRLDAKSIGEIDFNTISVLTYECSEKAYEYRRILRNIAQEKRQAQSQQNVDEWSSGSSDIQPHKLNELIQELDSLNKFVGSNEALLSNVAALLLLGDAGKGKTHLLCDVAQNRIRLGLPTVLLLGEQFNNDEPWSQIIGLLGLSCTKEELLGALEVVAQARQTRTIILIDALNEGEGKKLWKKYLAGMLATLANFPHLGIAISVRTPYKDVVVPKSLGSDSLIQEIHHGFAQHEYQATRTFFDYFGIKRPSIPLLNPEFQNPLFLKLFCLGLKNRGWIEVPPGFFGIVSVFEFLIDSVNIKLSSEEYLNFDEKVRVVQKAVQRLAEAIAENSCQWLSREKAQDIINALLPREGYHNSLFRHLLIEGIISEDYFWQKDGKAIDGIRFSYERLSDHLVVKYLLDTYLDPNNLSTAFLPTSQLGSLLKDYSTCWHNRGLLEAFSIQIPERLGKELVEVAPHCAAYSIVLESFVQSLIWRAPNSIGEATHQFIDSHIIQNYDTHNSLLNAFLTVASNENHPYNADFLHKRLEKDSMSDRDAWWSTFIHNQYGQHEAVDRLVDWAWTAEDKSHIDNEAIRLCAITLAWFLTTSNRFLRDRATKALVALLTPRIDILRQVISKFLNVDDWYILERLYAVAYGCAMRSTDDIAIAQLAQDVYDWVFKNGKPIPHILFRDYARGVIELALSRDIEVQINVALIRPPYKSKWLSHIPTNDELKIYTEQAEELLKRNVYRDNPSINQWRSVLAIQSSLFDYGDFARYVIGNNPTSFPWTSQRLDEPPSRKEIYDTFVNSLTNRQKKVWEQYRVTLDTVERYRQLAIEERIELFGHEFTEQQLEDVIAAKEQSLRRVLGKKKSRSFAEYIVSYSENSTEKENQFDLSIAQRWIFWRVFNLGWTVERFGWFDSQQANNNRAASKAERIGKKYQWLAYHEFLARVSDNFKFNKDRWNLENEHGYDGPWQLYNRDIDPSCLLKETQSRDCDEKDRPWWISATYELWDKHSNNIEWLQDKDDLPSIEALIDITNSKNNSRWLALENYSSWDQPVSPGEERPTPRQIWYMIKS